MPRASWDFIGSCALPVPPIEEQGAIADFLDRETAKIYTLMSKKRTLIERLKEKRTALISRTVTRGLPPDAARAAGLDPHPKLKPSGIDWLGDVPEHWEREGFGSSAPRISLNGPSGRADLDESDYVDERHVPYLDATSTSAAISTYEIVSSRPRIHLGAVARLPG